jgi:hypothetical protein
MNVSCTRDRPILIEPSAEPPRRLAAGCAPSASGQRPNVRHRLVAVLLAAAGLASSACSRSTPCWQRDRLQAEVTVRGPDLEVGGRLTFVRPTPAGLGTLQLDVERDGHLDNATLLASGATTAFTDGVPRKVTAREQRALAVLAAAFAWPGALAERTATADGAEVVMPDGARFQVLVGAEVPQDRGHHAR